MPERVDTSSSLPLAYRVAAARDALGTYARPAVVIVEGGRIVAVGHPQNTLIPSGVRVVDLPRILVLPAFVNAHAHLDLTAIGPRLYDGDFAHWLRSVIDQGPVQEGQITRAVAQGVALSHGSGTGYLGDITSRSAAVTGRRLAGHLPGVTYLECFGLGGRQSTAIAQLGSQLDGLRADLAARRLRSAPSHQSDGAGSTQASDGGLVLGIQPHSPYSVGPDLYAAAAALACEHGYRLSTHLAETMAEVRFVRDADGPMADLVRELGRWDDAIKPTGQHPIDWLAPALERAPWLLAHCNYVEDHHIPLLARCRASVAYCPVASDYFGHHQPKCNRVHRYRDMLAGGVNVCLGTDSIICQPPNEVQPLGIGAQMRHLYRRDGTDPDTLLAMATVNGLRAMGFESSLASLGIGVPARLVGVRIDPNDVVDPLVGALKGDEPFEPLSDSG